MSTKRKPKVSNRPGVAQPTEIPAPAPVTEWVIGLAVTADFIAYAVFGDRKFRWAGCNAPAPMDATDPFRAIVQQAAGVGRLVNTVVQQPSTFNAVLKIFATAVSGHVVRPQDARLSMMQVGAIAVAAANQRLAGFATNTLDADALPDVDGLLESSPEAEKVVNDTPEQLRPLLRHAINSAGGRA